MINIDRGNTGAHTRETMKWSVLLANIAFEERSTHTCQLRMTVPVYVCINKA